MRRATIPVAVIGSLVLAFCFVWINRYSYQRIGTTYRSWQIVRVNSLTGQVCYSQHDGSWNSNPDAPPKWLDEYMRDGFRPAAPQGTARLGDIVDPKAEAEKYSLNTCR
jgi:hypothetical protein